MTDVAGYEAEMRACANAIGLDLPAIVIPEDRWVTLHGIRFHYLDWGNDEKPPLVLLHGGSLTAHTWDMAALLLQPYYHLIALDQRGHGDTDWTPDDQLDQDNDALMLSDTEAFIDFLSLERIILCGMSMGGNNAYRYAARHPDRLRALVIVDVAPELMPAGQERMRSFRRETETLARFEDFLERAVKFSPHRAPEHLRYSLLHALKQTADGWTWKQDHRRVAPDEAEVKRKVEELWAAARAITTQTLLVRGADSQVLSEDSQQRTAAAMVDCDTVTIQRATHNVHSDNPKDFVAAMDRWLVARLGPQR